MVTKTNFNSKLFFCLKVKEKRALKVLEKLNEQSSGTVRIQIPDKVKQITSAYEELEHLAILNQVRVIWQPLY